MSVDGSDTATREEDCATGTTRDRLFVLLREYDRSLSGHEDIVRDVSIVGDPHDHEVRSDDLSLGEDGQEDARNVAADAPRNDEQQRVHSVEDTRIEQEGDEGPVVATPCGLSSHRGSDVLAVLEESGEDHNGEEDGEARRDREVGKTNFGGEQVPDAVRSASLDEEPESGCERTDEYNARECDDRVVHSINSQTVIYQKAIG